VTTRDLTSPQAIARLRRAYPGRHVNARHMAGGVLVTLDDETVACPTYRAALDVLAARDPVRIRIALTRPQITALECLRGGGLDESPVLEEAWDNHGEVSFLPERAEALSAELTALANGEHEHGCRLRRMKETAFAAMSQRACVALTGLAGRVRREGKQ
jgi:hypothetical protein